MTIIEIAALDNGAHRNQSGAGTIPAGYAQIPDTMEIPATFPFVNVTVQNDIVTAISANQTAYDAAVKAAEEAAKNQPTPVTLESIQAQLETTQEAVDALLMGTN